VTTDPVVAAALDAIEARDWARLKPLLHPYLHWSAPAVTIRGRTKLLAHLETSPDVRPPASYELRDGQIYRLTFP
jgi:hypothetical protein